MDALTATQRAIDDAQQHHDAEIGVVPAIHQQCLERRVAISLGRRQAVNDRLQHLADVEAGLGGNQNRIGGIEPDHVLDLLLDLVGFGGGEIDLVENRHDLVIVLDRLVDIGERLRLDALARIDHQQRALAGGQ